MLLDHACMPPIKCLSTVMNTTGTIPIKGIESDLVVRGQPDSPADADACMLLCSAVEL